MMLIPTFQKSERQFCVRILRAKAKPYPEMKVVNIQLILQINPNIAGLPKLNTAWKTPPSTIITSPVKSYSNITPLLGNHCDERERGLGVSLPCSCIAYLMVMPYLTMIDRRGMKFFCANSCMQPPTVPYFTKNTWIIRLDGVSSRLTLYLYEGSAPYQTPLDARKYTV